MYIHMKCEIELEVKLLSTSSCSVQERQQPVSNSAPLPGGGAVQCTV